MKKITKIIIVIGVGLSVIGNIYYFGTRAFNEFRDKQRRIGSDITLEVIANTAKQKGQVIINRPKRDENGVALRDDSGELIIDPVILYLNGTKAEIKQ